MNGKQKATLLAMFWKGGFCLYILLAFKLTPPSCCWSESNHDFSKWFIFQCLSVSFRQIHYIWGETRLPIGIAFTIKQFVFLGRKFFLQVGNFDVRFCWTPCWWRFFIGWAWLGSLVITAIYKYCVTITAFSIFL